MDKELYWKLRDRYMYWFIIKLIDQKELMKRIDNLNKMYREDWILYKWIK